MGGSALAAALSTRLGVNKSERALEAALKNTELGVTSEELVAAEVKLLSAAQDVEISKNRRDVYTTAGGIAGGAAGGLMSEMLLGDLYAPDLPGDVDAPAPDQSGPEVVPPQEPEVAPDIPNDLPENNLPSEADPQPAPDVDQYDSDEGMTGDEDGEDPMETPPAPNLGSYTVEPGDNFWDIMEGQTSAKSLPTAEWMKVNQPENYQALIDLVRDVGNSDAGIREALGFGATMDDLQIGSQVDLDLLDYFARTIAENKGWIDHPEFDFTAITPEAESFIESRVKEIMI